MKRKLSSGEAILWSIAFPGFGQLLNGRLIKGLAFIALEIVINVQSNFNLAIFYSFHGEIQKAIDVTNIQWLMFYPCIYMFAMWDAYRETTKSDQDDYLYIPFAFSAYLLTVGLIFSTKIHIFDTVLGPIWFPILCLIPGFGIGFLIKWIVQRGKKAI